MIDILREPAVPGLIDAIETNQLTHGCLFARLPGTLLWDEPDIFGLLTNLDPSESFIYRTSFPPAEVDTRIEQVLKRFREQGCLPMHWQVSPSTFPVDLGEHLEAHELTFLGRVPGMAARLEDLVYQTEAGPDFIIEEVRNDAQVRLWSHILASVDGISNALEEGLCTLFSNPETDNCRINRLFLGLVDGEPVATSRLFGCAGVAGIWNVATLPGARGHGYGRLMTLAAAQAGIARGYHFAVLLATPAGYGLYSRLGFEEICHIDVYRSGE
jgi:ribosomal protein S18 acetylase RimI-like enzyme